MSKWRKIGSRPVALAKRSLAYLESAKNRGVWFPLEANTELIDAGHDPLLIAELYPECTPMLSLGLPDPPVFNALYHQDVAEPNR
jgi:hypothetical protein